VREEGREGRREGGRGLVYDINGRGKRENERVSVVYIHRE